jgi:hypothetical protein
MPGREHRVVSSKLKGINHEGHEVARRKNFLSLPSCTFVSLVVNPAFQTQYFGIFGSMRSAQARMPPARL